MCSHRPEGPYGRIWAGFVRAVLCGFALIEGSALVFGGLTLSSCLRRWAGLEDPEPCRHTVPGRAAVCVFAVWLAAHIGWRRFGVGGKVFAPKH